MQPAQERAGASSGPLAGLRFASKESMDVAGTLTTPGNPDYAQGRGPAAQDAPVVAALLEAGATWTGKTLMHELAYGITGINPHTGTPDNPRLPGHTAGGSSSGSGVAVGAGVVDFALGSDTAGSVRIPASYCGVWGMRPTHGRVDDRGVVPLALSLDTVGILAARAQVLQASMQVLLRGPATATRFSTVGIFASMPTIAPAAAQAMQATLARLQGLGLAQRTLAWNDWADTFDAQRIVQYAEFLGAHDEWLRRAQPRLGEDVAQHVEQARKLGTAEIGRAISARTRHSDGIRELVEGGVVLLMPVAPDIAPSIAQLKDMQAAMQFRRSVLLLNCLASVAGLPVATVPAGAHDRPIGMQLIGPAGSDEALLELAVRLAD